MAISFSRTPGRALLHGIGVLAVVFLGHACTSAPAPRRPDVVLITVDTLRADRLGVYGSRLRTPNIDRLARAGTLFEQAVCPMPATRPSHFSILTGRYPREHGVLHNGATLPDRFRTLPEVFRADGYSTAAFVAVALLDRQSGAARGFDTFVSPTDTNAENADAVIPRAVDWLRAAPRAKPVFLWVHLFDPHIPYDPEPAFRPDGAPAVVEELPQASWDRLLERAQAHGGDLPAPLFERALALYGGEVEQVDHWVGVLDDALQATGRADDTIVVLTADHGECFEHGIFFNHTNCLYDGAVHVPLIVRYPRRVPANARRGDLVELVELAPTLARLAGVPNDPFRGASLFDPQRDAPLFAVVEHTRLTEDQIRNRREKTSLLLSVAGEAVHWPPMETEHFAVRTPTWKLITSSPGDEVYNLAADPGETLDRAEAEPRRIAALRAQLRHWLAAHPAARNGQEAVPDGPLRETLRALGYAD